MYYYFHLSIKEIHLQYVLQQPLYSNMFRQWVHAKFKAIYSKMDYIYGLRKQSVHTAAKIILYLDKYAILIINLLISFKIYGITDFKILGFCYE